LDDDEHADEDDSGTAVEQHPAQAERPAVGAAVGEHRLRTAVVGFVLEEVLDPILQIGGDAGEWQTGLVGGVGAAAAPHAAPTAPADGTGTEAAASSSPRHQRAPRPLPLP